MAKQTFTMVGTISGAKETEKFKPFGVQEFQSGWKKKRLVFNMKCGDNRHSLTIEDGTYEKPDSKVYLFTKGEIVDGKTRDGEAFTLNWNERLTSPRLAEVAEFKKLVIDLEEPNRRYKLKKLKEKCEEGSVTDKDYEDLGLTVGCNLDDELNKSTAKRFEYVTGWDYADCLHRLIESGELNGKVFKVKGEVRIERAEINGEFKFYTKFVPTRIYLADNNDEQISEKNVIMYFNNEAVDSEFEDELGKVYVNGFTLEYKDKSEPNMAVPYSFVIPVPDKDEDEKGYKKAQLLKKRFTTDEGWKQIGITVDMLDGAQKEEFIVTDDMMSEEQLENIEFGLVTREEVVKEIVAKHGGNASYGERIKEDQWIGFMRGYTGAPKETDFEDDNFSIAPKVDELEDDDDLFA